MHSKEEIEASAKRLSGVFDTEIKVIRTSVHKKRIAPAGKVFFVATANDKVSKYHMTELWPTADLTEDEETEIKSQLAEKLKKHFNL